MARCLEGHLFTRFWIHKSVHLVTMIYGHGLEVRL